MQITSIRQAIPLNPPVQIVGSDVMEAKNLIEQANYLMAHNEQAAICQQTFAILIAFFTFTTDNPDVLLDLHQLLPDATLLAISRNPISDELTKNGNKTLTQDRLEQHKVLMALIVRDKDVREVFMEMSQELFDEYSATNFYPLMSKIIALYKLQSLHLTSPLQETEEHFYFLQAELEEEIRTTTSTASHDISALEAERFLSYIKLVA
jgi:hypothetical protein